MAPRDAQCSILPRTCRGNTEPIAGRPYALRLKAPLEGDTIVADLVKELRGRGHEPDIDQLPAGVIKGMIPEATS